MQLFLLVPSLLAMVSGNARRSAGRHGQRNQLLSVEEAARVAEHGDQQKDPDTHASQQQPFLTKVDLQSIRLLAGGKLGLK